MTQNFLNLNNKFVLITGSAGLLGIEHARALLEAGSNLILTDIILVLVAILIFY